MSPLYKMQWTSKLIWPKRFAKCLFNQNWRKTPGPIFGTMFKLRILKFAYASKIVIHLKIPKIKSLTLVVPHRIIDCSGR